MLDDLVLDDFREVQDDSVVLALGRITIAVLVWQDHLLTGN